MSLSTHGPLAGRIPRGLVGMIGLIILVESSLAAYHLDFTRFYIHDWRTVGKTVRERAEVCQVLCFGDSLVKFGVLPRLIEKETQAKAYNLSVCGGQAASSYFLLRRAIAAGAKPSTVVVDYAPHLLAAGPRHNIRQWPELLSPGEAVELGLRSRHAGFCAELALRWIFPSIKDRDEIRGVVLGTLKGRSPSRRADVLAHQRVWDQNLGADVHPERPSYEGEVDLSDPGYFPRNWSCHPFNEYYIHQMLKLAAAREIEVVWLLPPVVPRFQARRDELGLETAQMKFINAFIAKYKNLHVIDGRHAGFDHRDFIDALHLSRQGARTFSTRLAEALQSMARTQARSIELTTKPAGVVEPDSVLSSVALRLPRKGRRR